MCSSQRRQAFELATSTERLQVGGGYTVLVKNYDLRHKSLKQKPFFLNFVFCFYCSRC